MNYYKKIAEMLGVELDEEFSLKNNDDEILSSNYKITGFGGLLFKCDTKWCHSGYIDEIINGELTIVKLPWKPKFKDYYYYYSPYTELVCTEMWVSKASDYCMWKLGNCFRTKEEALTKGKEIMDQIQKEYEEA